MSAHKSQPGNMLKPINKEIAKIEQQHYKRNGINEEVRVVNYSAKGPAPQL